MPLAKSPMTRGSLPAPNNTRIMARTTSQCIKLIEPIYDPVKTGCRQSSKSRARPRGQSCTLHSIFAAATDEVVPYHRKSSLYRPESSAVDQNSRLVPPPHPGWQPVSPQSGGLDPSLIEGAVHFAAGREIGWSRDLL